MNKQLKILTVPGFGSQNLHDGSQVSVTLVTG